MLSFASYVLIILAAVAAGAVNALAGGGTLITFPTLTAMGIPAVAANMTNTVALCPGYLGGSLAQLKDLQGQERRLWLYVPAGIVGGLGGALLLRFTAEQVFRELVPYLILAATGLLAAQQPLRAWLARRAGGNHPRGGSGGSQRVWCGGPSARSDLRGLLPVGLATVYGGYFGAGLGVIVLAVLGLSVDDSLTRLNAVKQVISLAANVAAAVFFVFRGNVVWPVALVMFVGALVGGALGGKLAGLVKPDVLRQIVVVLGIVVAVIYFVRP